MAESHSTAPTQADSMLARIHEPIAGLIAFREAIESALPDFDSIGRWNESAANDRLSDFFEATKNTPQGPIVRVAFGMLQFLKRTHGQIDDIATYGFWRDAAACLRDRARDVSFAGLVSQMREAQHKYFETRDRGALRKAKALELRVDEELTKYHVNAELVAPEDAAETLPHFSQEVD